LKQFLKDYFTFNKRERNGILVLLFIIVSLITYLNLEQYFIHKPVADVSEFQQEVKGFVEEQRKIRESTTETQSPVNNKRYINELASKPKPELFQFDPNNLTREKWKQLGFEEWQVNAIESYLQKAGKLKSKEDFKKLRAVSDRQYQVLEPYIRFESINEKILPSDDVIEDKKKRIFELNTSTDQALTQIKGIGPVLSKRIVKYRKALGGYVSKEQIMEVYGIEDSLYIEIKDIISVAITSINTINLNKCSIDRLKSHPYIKWHIANAIVNYRDQHGPYQNVSDIRETDLVNDELFRKIAPYLSLGE